MSEGRLIGATPYPRTRKSLAGDLRDLGLRPGTVLITHSSLSSLGWVSGGSVAVVQALMDVVTPMGTLVMPTQSTDLSDPANWRSPPVPESWWQEIRDTMPAYDPRITPTREMGRIVETFRTWPGVVRSAHPALSFAAWGQEAERVINDHSLNYGLGEHSPLARLYELDARVLLLGVGYRNNTSFHLAEHRVPDQPLASQGAPVMRDGERVWTEYREVEGDMGLFGDLGAEFERSHDVRRGRVGSADARLFAQRHAVDYAVGWLTRRRGEDSVNRPTTR